ncbi:histidine kinase [Candidatus Sumerlaea chitinivorans]|uniref:histidine kinase n=1 Tax=Sumerlaea chitinivorans TaxID=2250252 RepID=A0A2Z4Y8A0_SUMC1|nr:histidine kinase [Candidatus Sumerlaea chitinivorans]
MSESNAGKESDKAPSVASGHPRPQVSQPASPLAPILGQYPWMRTLLDSVPSVLAVLDNTRRIVYVNQSLQKVARRDCEEEVCGLRLGEVLDCRHAQDPPDGCGSTPACTTCGAVRTITAALQGKSATANARIVRRDGRVFEFQAHSIPFKDGGTPYVILSLSDITHENRRATLEYLFGDDVLNLAIRIHGFAQFLTEVSPDRLAELKERISNLTGLLVEKIGSYQTLRAAEEGTLTVHPVSLESRGLLEQLVERFRDSDIARDKVLLIRPEAQNVVFSSDRTLLMQALRALTENALEASATGETVTLSCGPTSHGVVFEVHNPSAMSYEAQLQIFVRGFSTKGRGRGLGTYAARLFVESYLGGRVGFVSNAEAGTTFRIELPLHLAGSDGAVSE